MTVKEEAIKTIETLSENATWKDLLYTLYVRQQVADGMTEIERGEFVSHADVKSAFLNGNHLDT